MKNLIFVVALLFSSSSFASVLVEPYLDYGSGIVRQKNVNTNDGKLSGKGYGLRLGYSLPIVFAALDFHMGQQTFDPDNSSANEDATIRQLGFVVGVTVPLGLRLWGGLNWQDQFKLQETSGNSYLRGSGFKVGVGYKLPLIPISINVEYLKSNYDTVNGSDLGNNTVTSDLVQLSVSFPFGL